MQVFRDGTEADTTCTSGKTLVHEFMGRYAIMDTRMQQYVWRLLLLVLLVRVVLMGTAQPVIPLVAKSLERNIIL
jgi:hypothetical protein